MPEKFSSADIRGAVDLSSLGGAATAQSPATGAAGPVQIPVPSFILPATDATAAPVLELSRDLPLVIVFVPAADAEAGKLVAQLSHLVTEFAGRFLLVTVDADTNPQLTAAFQVSGQTTVAAVIGGQPLHLFEGSTLADDELRSLLAQVVSAAAQNGLTGIAVLDTAAQAGEGETVEAPLPPHHQEAFDAIEAGDFDTAAEAYKKALAENPGDKDAHAGLAQVQLLSRLKGKTLAEIRQKAADNPNDLQAALDIADLDLSGGHVEDAFDRLLTIYPSSDADTKNLLRERILELFEVVGATDPRVIKARTRLSNLLY